MVRKDLIQINTKIFLSMGKAIEAVAATNIKVLVVANPANTNALVTLKQCSRVPAKNFCAMTRLDYNRAQNVGTIQNCMKKSNGNFNVQTKLHQYVSL